MKKLIYLLIIAVIIGMGVVVSGMYTNSRYYLDVTADSHPRFANSYFRVTPEGQDTFDVIPGQSRDIRYDLQNMEGSGKINENNLIYYISLVDGDGNSNSLPIGMSLTGYSNVEGKGYGPISLASDGTTGDLKVLTMRISCDQNYRVKTTLNYNIRVYAESVNDPTIFATKDTPVNFRVLCYSIRYFVDGVEDPTLEPNVYCSTDIVTLPTLSMSGKIFEGWYQSEDCSGAAYDSFSNWSGDKLLYGKFEDRGLKITYVLYDGLTEEHEYPEGSSVSLLVPNERAGYIFEGWYLEPEHTNRVNSIDSIDHDMTLYANWTSDGGSFSEGSLINFIAPSATNSSTGDWVESGVTGYDAESTSYYLQNLDYTGYYRNDAHAEQVTFTKDSMSWYVWERDKKNNTITLISDRITSQQLSLWGAVGYSNGMFFMNDICNMLYGGGGEIDGIYARNIRLSDIETKIMKNKNMELNDANRLALRRTYNTNYLGSASSVTNSNRYVPFCYGNTTESIDFFNDENSRKLEDTGIDSPSTELSILRDSIKSSSINYTITNLSTELDEVSLGMIKGNSNGKFWIATRGYTIAGKINYMFKAYNGAGVTQSIVYNGLDNTGISILNNFNNFLRPMIIIDLNKIDLIENDDGTVSYSPKS